MIVLILGLVLFLGIHSVMIGAAGWRGAMVARLGEGPWKGLYVLAIAATVGLGSPSIAQDVVDPIPDPAVAGSERGPTRTQVIGDYFDGLRAWELGEREIAVGIWLEAAQWGDHRAMRRLGELYAAGELLPKDEALAYFWFALTAKMGGRASDFLSASNLRAKLPSEHAASIYEAVVSWEPTTPQSAPAAAEGDTVAAGSGPKTPDDLWAAWEARDLRTFAEILANGVAADAPSPDGTPIAFLAAASSKAEFLRELLDAGADPNAALSSGMTMLHVAAGVGSAEIAELLIAKGGSACSSDQNGVFPVEIARKKGAAEAERVLREAEDVSGCVTECDLASAHPYNTDNPVGGTPVEFKDLELRAAQAVASCERLVSAFPRARRFHYQLGRALHAEARYPEAVQMYERAAEGGSSMAMYQLGLLYHNGEKVPQDYERARRWYEGAVENGGLGELERNCVHNLGLLLDQGLGGPRDTERASKLFLRAMAAGFAHTFEEFRSNSTAYDPEVVYNIQRFLIANGYLDGEADGKVGSRTVAALDAYRAVVENR
jgi:TPR repeat protein